MNDMNRDVKNGDVSGGNCFTNSHTLFLRKNYNSVDSSNNSDEKFSQLIFNGK